MPHAHEQHNVIGEFAMTANCGQGHFFCWDCAREGHEPATCQNWRDWFEKIGELRPETLTNTGEKEELSANYLWLVTHSKSCPNPSCLAPIQKHDGCNHIRCYKVSTVFKGGIYLLMTIRVYEIDTQKNGNFTQTVHIFEAVSYHTKKKRKTKQSDLYTDLVNKNTNFLLFSQML